MKALWNEKSLWNELIDDENGFILSAELIMILTIAVLGMVVGLSHVALAVNQELSDFSCAIGALNQSYNFTGFHCCLLGGNGRFTSATAGSAFLDLPDVCDCAGLGISGSWGKSFGGFGGGTAGSGGYGGGYSDLSSGSISSGPVCAPAPVIEAPHCAPVTTPCVNCPPVSQPSPMLAPPPL